MNEQQGSQQPATLDDVVALLRKVHEELVRLRQAADTAQRAAMRQSSYPK